MSLDSFGNIADIVAVPIAIVGLYFVVRQLSLARAESEKEHQRRKNEITLNAYNAIREDLRETSFKVREKLHLKNMFDDLNENHTKKILMDEELKTDVSKMLSIFERFAVGVQHDVFNINLISDLSGTVFIQTFKQFKPYIDVVRENSKTFYIAYEELVKELETIKDSKQ